MRLMRHALLVIATVFGAIAFAIVLPGAYPRLIAMLAGVDAKSAHYVWGMTDQSHEDATKQTESQAQQESEHLQRLKERLARYQSELVF